MAKKDNPGDASRRERAAAIRAAQARKQRTITLTIGSVTAVIVIVLGLIVAKSLQNAPKADPSQTSGLASATVVNALANVSDSDFDTVGVGSASNGPKKISGGTAMTADGKPRILYVGSEYCPYCAAERWGLVVALDRFGSFTNLGQTASSSTDVDPNTNTLAFHGAKYTSKYLSFTGYEQQNRDQSKTIDTLSKDDQAIFNKLDTGGSIPFIDIGGIYVGSGASYDPGILKGMTHDQIAKAISDTSSDVSKGIIGTANLFTAAICGATGGMPSNVCTSAGVTAAAAQLG
ncbi:MAG TPA: DUF929 family protein [Marmoricola sp.]|jgi:hypothetical protein|nr:DUF929 family protein [Marmoricola sp.]